MFLTPPLLLEVLKVVEVDKVVEDVEEADEDVDEELLLTVLEDEVDEEAV